MQKLVSELRFAGFLGEIFTDLSHRWAYGSDNSVYYQVPECVLCPSNAEDFRIMAEHLANLELSECTGIYARGAGTGTNGQSLGKGITIDFARHLKTIKEYDPTTQCVEVEPGVTLQELNSQLQTVGRYFPIEISTANRATIGGMLATDACGKSSLLYGKTSDWVEALSWYATDGKLYSWSKANGFSDAKLEQELIQLCKTYKPIIKDNLPDIPRYFSGYNFYKVFEDDKIQFHKLFGGSEGTLGLIAAITLKTVPLPLESTLYIARFASLIQALQSTRAIRNLSPESMEFLDALIVAQGLESMDSIVITQQFATLPGTGHVMVLVEPGSAFKDFAELVKAGFVKVNNQSDWWKLRAQGVEMLTRQAQAQMPVAFVEDCALHPNLLPYFVQELQELLHAKGIRYAIYGHGDAGCLHLRPCLNLFAPVDHDLFIRISYKVEALVHKYGGILWGEHGKGMRSAYLKNFVSQDYLEWMSAIKLIMDAKGLLNPGKLVATSRTPFLDPFDSLLAKQWPALENAEITQGPLRCNGNGACLHATQSFCPTYAYSNDLLHSPKGRAAALREWFGILAQHGFKLEQNPLAFMAKWKPFWKQLPYDKRTELKQQLQQVHIAMDACLACSACSTQCPAAVNISDWVEPIRYCYNVAKGKTLDVFFASVVELLLRKVAKIYYYKDLKKLSSNVEVPFLVPDALSMFMDRSMWKRLLKSPWGKAHITREVAITGKFPGAACRYVKYWPVQSQVPWSVVDPYLNNHHPVAHLPGFLPLPQWLALTKPALCDFIKPDLKVHLLLHCHESSKADIKNAWHKLFKSQNITYELHALPCCGMAGPWGMLPKNRKTSKALFQKNWEPLLAVIPEQDVVLISGASCRMQLQRIFKDRKTYSPLEFWAGVGVYPKD
jgi:FAD/FMN-containing dehydrogenase/Fe-S oxidoreductase